MTEASDPVSITPLAAILTSGRWRLTDLHADPRPMLYGLSKGQGRVFVSGKQRGFSGPCFLFVPAGCTTRFDFPTQIFGQQICFGAGFEAHLPGTAVLLRSLSGPTLAEMTHFVTRIESESQSRISGAETAMSAYGTLLALTVTRLHLAEGAPDWCQSKAESIVAGFTALIETDLAAARPSAPPSVAGYAARLGITPTHLTRVCRSVSGLGASGLLQSRLLSEGRRRLADTPLPVHQIADALGYGSAAYFARSFGAHMGQTPSAARRALRASAPFAAPSAKAF